MHRKVIAILLNIVIVILFSKYARLHINVYSCYRERMYKDFENFGKELEHLNDNISQILVLNKYDFDDDKEFIRNSFVRSFWISSFRAWDILEKQSYKYSFDLVYHQVNDVIKNILYDHKITESEENYLRTLYDYNDAMISEYKKILGDAYYKYDYELQQNLEKSIINIYNEYSAKSIELLSSRKYYFLQNYKGDFYGVNFKKERKYCEEVFYKLIKDQKLEYDNSSTSTDILRYITEGESKGKNGINIINSIVDNKTPVYEVQFDKQTKIIDINCIRHTFLKKRYKEEELDTIAQNIISKFNLDLINYSKEVIYDEEEKLNRIIYKNIEKNNDIYDETKVIEIMLYYDGVLARFKTVYPYNEPIYTPIINKEEVLKKVNKEAEILDIITVRNIYGKIEYEVHLNYKGNIYAAIFDTETGEVKYYGRNIRDFTTGRR